MDLGGFSWDVSYLLKTVVTVVCGMRFLKFLIRKEGQGRFSTVQRRFSSGDSMKRDVPSRTKRRNQRCLRFAVCLMWIVEKRPDWSWRD